MGRFWNRGSKGEEEKEEEKFYDLQEVVEYQSSYNDQSYISQEHSGSNIEYESNHSDSDSESSSGSRSGSDSRSGNSDDNSSSSEQYDDDDDDDAQGRSSPNNKNKNEKIEDEGQEDAINSTNEEEKKKKKGNIFGRISLFGGRKNKKEKQKDNKKSNENDDENSNDSFLSEGDIEIDDNDGDDKEEESYDIDVMDEDDEESSVSEKEEEEDDSSFFLEHVEDMEEVQDESSFREEDGTINTSFNNVFSGTRIPLQVPQLTTPSPPPSQKIDTRGTATNKIRYIPSQPSESKSKKKIKPKSKTKTKNMTRNTSTGTGTGTGTRHPDPLLGTEVNELTNEVSRLRTLVKLMMDRMDLYETQSEYLVEANQDHDIEWKKTMIENYGPSSSTNKTRSLDSNTIIKNLLDEQVMSNQWIQRLEGVQRGYQQRVIVTQNQLKTLRFEQIQTNRQIVEVKRASAAKKKLPPPPAKSQLALLRMSGSDDTTPIRNNDHDRVGIKRLERSASTGDISNNNSHVNQLRMKKHVQKHRMSSMVEEMMSTWEEEGNHIQPVMTYGRYNQTKEDQTEKAKTKKKKKTTTKTKTKSKSKNTKSSKKKHKKINKERKRKK
jgi:hypothetical protein